MKIVRVEQESIAEELGIRPGDELLEINGQRVRDSIDYRFSAADAALSLRVARDGEVVIYDIEKEEGEDVGLELEEMKILSCGNDCIFCFVDQNPEGLRKQLYFRDGDYRLSFMYGNYTTMTNAGPATIDRIIEQRLSPQYISVHVTDLPIRMNLMGLRKDDLILEKIGRLHDHGIDMHTQIVLCPGLNDGPALEKTVSDLYRFHRRIVSLAIVPVGLTDHRFGLTELQRVDAPYARELLDRAGEWQERFRAEIGRGFVYPSDEFYFVAGRDLPPAASYDGFPQLENGVGMVRSFLREFHLQLKRLPKRLPARRSLAMVTGTLAEGFMASDVLPHLEQIRNLRVRLHAAPNLLFGESVTVAGLLSGNCVYSALRSAEHADLLLLPPDIVNADGLLLDDMSVPELERKLGVRAMIFDGSWQDVFSALQKP